MSSPFFQGVVSSLGRHITDAAQREQKKRLQEEAEEKSVFETLLKSPDRNLQEIGLAGLMEKPKYGWLSKRIPGESRQKVKDYFSKIDEDEKKVRKDAPPPAVTPTLTTTGTYEVNLPPEINDRMEVDPGLHRPETTTLSPPPSPPSATEITAPPERDALTDLKGLRSKWGREHALDFGAKDPYAETIAFAEQLAASGASKEEIAAALRAGAESKLDPLGTKFGYQKDLKSAEWEFRVSQDAAKHGYKMEELDAQNMVSLTPSQAERFGLPAGTRLHHRVMSDLTRAGIAHDANATRLSVASMIQSGMVTQIRTVDEQGRPITMIVPRRDAAGIYTTQPSSTDEGKATTQQMMLKDIERVEELYSPELVGAGRGVLEKGKRVFDKADPKWVQMSDLLDRMRTGRLYNLSGKAVAEWERRRIGSQVPQLDTFFSSPQKFEQQMRGYKREVENFLQEFRGGMYSPDAPPTPGRPTKTGITPPPKQMKRTKSGVEYTVE